MRKFTLEDRVEISNMMMEILVDWGVSNAEQIALLALPADTKPRAMKKYQEGSTPLPDELQVWERIEHFAGINDALRTSYPRNAKMGAIWLHTVNSRFADRTPLACMLEEGLNGVVAVRVHLDCAYDWHEDQRSSEKNTDESK